MRRLVLANLMVFLSACGASQVKQSVGHSAEFQYPEETEHFIAKELHVYDDPLYGASLAWLDKAYRYDVITLYVYPILDTEWENKLSVIADEMNHVLEEVKYGVEAGHYKEVSEAITVGFEFEHNDVLYAGMRSTFEVRAKNDVLYDSNAYLFITEDKFVKFRTSFDSHITPDWNGDNVVKEILPNIQVEPESPYMKSLRDNQRAADEAQMEDIVRQLLEAAVNDNGNGNGNGNKTLTTQ